ncbi:MAG: hypothetical protein ABI255_09180 [Microbacteriaceae bacterium]
MPKWAVSRGSTIENTHRRAFWHRFAAPRDWRNAYSWRLAITDLLVLIWVVFGVQIAWFGLETTGVSFRNELRDTALSGRCDRHRHPRGDARRGLA